MRIVQHKAPATERPAMGEQVEVIGLAQNNPIDQAVVSSSPKEKFITIEQSQAAHIQKPPQQNVGHKPNHHTIQQPRK